MDVRHGRNMRDQTFANWTNLSRDDAGAGQQVVGRLLFQRTSAIATSPTISRLLALTLSGVSSGVCQWG